MVGGVGDSIVASVLKIKSEGIDLDCEVEVTDAVKINWSRGLCFSRHCKAFQAPAVPSRIVYKGGVPILCWHVGLSTRPVVALVGLVSFSVLTNQIP